MDLHDIKPMNKNKTPFDLIQTSLIQKIPENVYSYLPRKWEKIGDVLILKLPLELNDYKKQIAKTYANILHCSSVLLDKGGINGALRIPDTDLIFGNENTETIHRENGVRFALDPAKVMFSSGNMNERKRMSRIVHRNETVVDLFAGIGYFTIPMAVHSKPDHIIACEINPVSYQYLCKNILLNDVSDIVKPLLGDSKKIAPKDTADRVIMGYFGNTIQFLSTAVECLKNQRGIIHFHDTFPDEDIPKIPRALIEKKLVQFQRMAKLLQIQKVKTYAPGISHYVFDIAVEKL